MHPSDILINTLTKGPAWNLSQKKDLDYSIKRSISLTGISMDPTINIFIMEDINQFYPPRHLIPWRIPEDYSDVLDWAFTKPKITCGLSRLGKFMFENIKLDENLRFFDDLDDIQLSSQKKSFYKGESVKACKSRVLSGYRGLDFIDCENYKLSFTTKSPCEARVIAIPDIPTRNHQYTIRRATEQINNCPVDAYGKPRWNFDKFLKKQDGTYFIMVDQKKSGWTFPQELFTLYFSILREHYPSYYYFDNAAEIFKNNRIFYNLNDREYSPVRGFTLGMYDNIMSFILSCMFLEFSQMCKDKLNYGDNFSIDGRFWGDDQIIKVKAESELIATKVWVDWITHLRRYGVEINMKKSFYSDEGIFCEVYTPNSEEHYFDKYMTYSLMPFNSMRGINTYHRKILWNCYNSQVKNAMFWFQGTFIFDYLVNLHKETMTYLRKRIGYEFHPNELSQPVELGGWETFTDIDGYNLILDILNKEFVPCEFLRVAMVEPCDSILRPYNKKKGLGTYDTLPIVKLLKDRLKDIGNKRDLFSGISARFKEINMTDLWSDSKQRCKAIHRTAKERKLAYASKVNNVSNVSIINIFYKRKNFSNIKLTSLNLPRNNSITSFFDTEQKPYKGSTITEPVRATLMFVKKFFNENLFNLRYLNENFSIRDLDAGANYQFTQSKWVIPNAWMHWCEHHGITWQELYDEFEENNYTSILFYDPPINVKTFVDALPGGSSNEDGSAFYWDDDYGHLFHLSESELMQIHYWGYQGHCKVILDRLNISFEEYGCKIEARHPPVKEVEEELTKEEKDFLESGVWQNYKLAILKEEEPPMRSYFSGMAVVTDIDQLQDYVDSEEDDYLNESYEEEIPQWKKDLYDQGVDLINLDFETDSGGDVNPIMSDSSEDGD